jgi:iron(III) transport system substrate-binding protein
MEGPMSKRWVAMGLLLVGVLAAACTSARAPAGTTENPAGAVAGDGGAGTSEWDQVVAAARREGRIVVSGPETAAARAALGEGFEARYPDIRVEYTGSPGSQVPPKILNERQAGLYQFDVVVNGTSTQYDLVKAGALDPVEAYLVGPQARNAAAWMDGKHEFADDAGTHILVTSHVVAPTLTVNPDVVPPNELRSYRDLLDPKWKGKVALMDPRIAGTGQAMVLFLYAADGLGKEYLRQLFTQDLILSRDPRQIVDWVIRGQYPVELSGSQLIVADLRSKGLRIEMRGAEEIAEGSYLTAGPGAVGVLNRAPHPNATKVFLDYLLSYDGQLAFNRAIGYASRLQGVPTDHIPANLTPRPGVRYAPGYKQQYIDLRPEVAEFVRSLVGA